MRSVEREEGATSGRRAEATEEGFKLVQVLPAPTGTGTAAPEPRALGRRKLPRPAAALPTPDAVPAWFQKLLVLRRACKLLCTGLQLYRRAWIECASVRSLHVHA